MTPAMNIHAVVGLNVSRLRTMRGLTQQELSSQAGLSRHYLVGIEAGMRNPSIEILAKLADALGVKVEALVKDVRPAAVDR